ncbi:MAG: GNAT family N-acetyltransferase [Nannocystales bacterium]
MSALLAVRELTDADRELIATWRYSGELGIYDPGAGALELKPPHHVAIVTGDGMLLGFGTMGPDAQVAGGRYGSAESVLDLGVGLCPARVGQGYGPAAIEALIAYARTQSAATRLRVTIAAVNKRASALAYKLGFRPSHRFTRTSDARAFVQHERPVGTDPGSS